MMAKEISVATTESVRYLVQVVEMVDFGFSHITGDGARIRMRARVEGILRAVEEGNLEEVEGWQVVRDAGYDAHHELNSLPSGARSWVIGKVIGQWLEGRGEVIPLS